MSQEERFQEVLNQLKKAGYRITEQRKLLLYIILNNEYSSCKEIYYAAKKQDGSLYTGFAFAILIIFLLLNASSFL